MLKAKEKYKRVFSEVVWGSRRRVKRIFVAVELFEEVKTAWDGSY